MRGISEGRQLGTDDLVATGADGVGAICNQNDSDRCRFDGPASGWFAPVMHPTLQIAGTLLHAGWDNGNWHSVCYLWDVRRWFVS